MRAGEWILRSRRVVTTSGTRPADVLIRDELIVDLLPYDGPESEGVILDAEDMVVLPGLVALHREVPEATASRWFDAATRDCAAGGVTTLVDLPPRSGNGSATLSIDRLAAAGGTIRVDCGLVVPLGRGEAGRIDSWMEAGFLGVEAVLEGEGQGREGDRGSSTTADVQAAMPILASLDRPLLVDLGRLPGRNAPTMEPAPEPAVVRFLVRLCRETGCRVHLIHPSTVDSLALIAEAHAEGLLLTAETCPQDLGIVDGGAKTQTDVDFPVLDVLSGLWEGLEAGWIAAIGPDHLRPDESLSAERDRPIGRALASVWAEVARRGGSIDRLAGWMSRGTAAPLGLAGRKGAIAANLDADFVVFDPGARRVEATILRGCLIYQSGRLIEQIKGSVVLRLQLTEPISGRNA